MYSAFVRRINQYFVSFASFKDIYNFDKKSAYIYTD